MSLSSTPIQDLVSSLDRLLERAGTLPNREIACTVSFVIKPDASLNVISAVGSGLVEPSKTMDSAALPAAPLVAPSSPAPVAAAATTAAPPLASMVTTAPAGPRVLTATKPVPLDIRDRRPSAAAAGAATTATTTAAVPMKSATAASPTGSLAAPPNVTAKSASASASASPTGSLAANVTAKSASVSASALTGPSLTGKSVPPVVRGTLAAAAASPLPLALPGANATETKLGNGTRPVDKVIPPPAASMAIPGGSKTASVAAVPNATTAAVPTATVPPAAGAATATATAAATAANATAPPNNTDSWLPDFRSKPLNILFWCQRNTTLTASMTKDAASRTQYSVFWDQNVLLDGVPPKQTVWTRKSEYLENCDDQFAPLYLLLSDESSAPPLAQLLELSAKADDKKEVLVVMDSIEDPAKDFAARQNSTEFMAFMGRDPKTSRTSYVLFADDILHGSFSDAFKQLFDVVLIVQDHFTPKTLRGFVQTFIPPEEFRTTADETLAIMGRSRGPEKLALVIENLLRCNALPDGQLPCLLFRHYPAP